MTRDAVADRSHSDEDAATCAAYALNALPEPERAAFATHVDACEPCRVELTHLHNTAAQLGAASSPLPVSAQRRASTLAQAASTPQVGRPAPKSRPAPGPWRRPAASAVAGTKPWQRSSTWTRATRALAVAATVLGLASAGLGAIAVDQNRRLDQISADAGRVEQLLAQGDSRSLTAATRAGGRATAVVADGQAVVLLTDLRSLPRSNAYQLWVSPPDGRIRSAGVLDLHDRRGSAVVQGVPAGAELMLSIEPAEGSPQPTGQVVWRVSA